MSSINNISLLSLEILNDASLGYTKIHDNSIKKVKNMIKETVSGVIYV